MGLDMYLTAERYVSGYSFKGEEETKLYGDLVALAGAESYVDEESPSAYIRLTVAYWRKANQIHTWFVENVQGGEDECKPHYVSHAQLRDLRDLCAHVLGTSELSDGTVHNGTIYNAEHPQGAVQLEPGKIVADPRAAHNLLPTAEGFFFGSTDYDEWYWRDLQDTVDQLDRVLRMPEGDWTFEYRSSW